jgi:hypothetical protein
MSFENSKITVSFSVDLIDKEEKIGSRRASLDLPISDLANLYNDMFVRSLYAENQFIFARQFGVERVDPPHSGNWDVKITFTLRQFDECLVRQAKSPNSQFYNISREPDCDESFDDFNINSTAVFKPPQPQCPVVLLESGDDESDDESECTFQLPEVPRKPRYDDFMPLNDPELKHDDDATPSEIALAECIRVSAREQMIKEGVEEYERVLKKFHAQYPDEQTEDDEKLTELPVATPAESIEDLNDFCTAAAIQVMKDEWIGNVEAVGNVMRMMYTDSGMFTEIPAGFREAYEACLPHMGKRDDSSFEMKYIKSNYLAISTTKRRKSRGFDRRSMV